MLFFQAFMSILQTFCLIMWPNIIHFRGLVRWKQKRGRCAVFLSIWKKFCRAPPSFKEVTPRSRTNMRQLLVREQCLQREQKLGLHSNKQQLPRSSQHSSLSAIGVGGRQHEMATATIAITRGSLPPQVCVYCKNKWTNWQKKLKNLKCFSIKLISYVA